MISSSRVYAQAPVRDPSRCAPQMMSVPFAADSGPSWNGWSPDVTNRRFQPAEQAGLPAAQVPRLTLKWAFGFPDTVSAYAQPSVAGGRVFVGAQNGIVYSLDAKTGCTYWTFKAQSAIRAAATVGLRRTAAGERAYTVYVGDQSAHIYAIDAQTGDLLWAHKVDDLPGARVTGAPTLYQDRLYVPVASSEEADARNPAYACCKFRGSLVVLDVNGNVVWKTFTLTENAKPLGKTSAGAQRWGPSGAGIWSAPTIDAARKLVYVSTGNMYTEPQQPTSDAVIAMDLDSGKIKWMSQRLDKDVWIVGCPPAGNNCAASASDIGPDFDLGDSPMLVKMANGKDAIVVGQKSGQAWALDPDKRGAVLWEYRAGRGGTLGGIEWGPAVDATNAYFAVSDFRLDNPGGLHAVNLVGGQRAWLTPAPPPACTGAAPNCSGAQSAAITVIPDTVFSGSVDGALRAYSTTDGAIVWTFDANREFPTVNGVKANGASFGGGGPVVVGGMVFTNSGYGVPAGRAGNVLLAFGIE
ncbi:MAG TPA: PQQ-binding-like beta-propeller repeat protein [Vicinamibacterales bacterium]|nr:PQQ-binding-like beta-propeller repeat protein [Vicinamibacterales bacterium]